MQFSNWTCCSTIEKLLIIGNAAVISGASLRRLSTLYLAQPVSSSILFNFPLASVQWTRQYFLLPPCILIRWSLHSSFSYKFWNVAIFLYHLSSLSSCVCVSACNRCFLASFVFWLLRFTWNWLCRRRTIHSNKQRPTRILVIVCCCATDKFQHFYGTGTGTDESCWLIDLEKKSIVRNCLNKFEYFFRLFGVKRRIMKNIGKASSWDI